ncbi:MAG: S41 family peptidase, partial [Microgenomates group bacterium]
MLLTTLFIIFSNAQNKTSFEKWLSSSPLGLTAISFAEALFFVETNYYQALRPEQIEAIKTIKEDCLSEIVGLLDKHSSYYNAEEYEEFQLIREGKFEGVGLHLSLPYLTTLIEKRETILKEIAPRLDIRDQNLKRAIIRHLKKTDPQFEKLERDIAKKIISQEGILIEEVMPNSPAEKAGVKRGWYIGKIDGKKLEGVSLDEAIKMIRGPKGTKVKLTLYPPKNERGSPTEVEIERSIVKRPLITKAELLSFKVGYIKLTNFDEGIDEDFKNKVVFLKSQGMKSLIIDLRDNPGGLVNMADKILESLVPAGRIEIYTKERNGLNPFWSPPENVAPKIFSGKIAVLINENSASAAELVAISLKEQGVAIIIGRPSYGKASIQKIVSLTDGTALCLTIG